MYKPLAKTSAFDYRSTFSFTKDSKPASAETRYTSVNLSLTAGSQYVNPTRPMISVIFTEFIKCCAFLCFLLTLPFSAFICLKMVHQYERIVVFRIGHLLPLKGPGIVFVFPCIDRWSRVDLRTKAFNVPPTRICTVDGGLILFGSVVHYRVQNPILVKNSLQDMNHSVRVACQAAMSKILSKKRFSDLKTSSARCNYDIQMEINDAAVEWGLEIGKVELCQPTVEVAPPDEQKSGFFSKLSSGMSQGCRSSGSDDSMAQVMNAMAAAGQGFVNPSISSATNSTSFSQPAIPATVDVAAKTLVNAIKCLMNPEMVSKVDATYEIKLSDNNKYYFIDLKNGSGSCGEGRLPNGTPDATLSLSYETLQDLLTGQLGAFSAYTGGKLDVEGDVRSAMRLEELGKSLKA